MFYQEQGGRGDTKDRNREKTHANIIYKISNIQGKRLSAYLKNTMAPGKLGNEVTEQFERTQRLSGG